VSGFDWQHFVGLKVGYRNSLKFSHLKFYCNLHITIASSLWCQYVYQVNINIAIDIIFGYLLLMFFNFSIVLFNHPFNDTHVFNLYSALVAQ
jgi:hypothetical protein